MQVKNGFFDGLLGVQNLRLNPPNALETNDILA
jgi:hypothetical protein